MTRAAHSSAESGRVCVAGATGQTRLAGDGSAFPAATVESLDQLADGSAPHSRREGAKQGGLD